MAITVYTYNDKVLKNSVNDKWLKKPDAPAGFVMNASNATISNNTANWESPNYPEYCNLGGKTAIVTISETISAANLTLYYSASLASSAAPSAFVLLTDSNDHISAGTYTLTLSDNQATPAQGAYGKYLTLFRYGPDTTIDTTFLSKITIQILD